MGELSVNGQELDIFGLVLTNVRMPKSYDIKTVQLAGKTVSGAGLTKERIITVDVFVTAATEDELITKVDSVKQYLDTTDEVQLILGWFPSRYWNVRLQNMADEFVSGGWEAVLTFIADDGLAWSVNEIVSTYTLLSGVQDLSREIFGNAPSRPVVSFTPNVSISSAVVTLQKTESGEVITWVGDIESGEELVIDCVRWVVELDGVPAMSELTDSDFFELLPGWNVVSFTIESDYGPCTGVLTISYRNRYK